MTVMIVDDNVGMRAAIRENIQPICESIWECSDGSEALGVYTRYKPDWVLMDIVMKQMDGFTASEQILRTNPTAKIIILTQFKDFALLEKAQRIGVKNFVQKEHLREVVEIMSAKKNTI